MSSDCLPPETDDASGRHQVERVTALVSGYLSGCSPGTRTDRRNDLDTWFAFCAEFNIDPLSAGRSHLVGYVLYQSEVADETTERVTSRLGTLSGFYDHALVEGAVVSNPVPW